MLSIYFGNYPSIYDSTIALQIINSFNVITAIYEFNDLRKRADKIAKLEGYFKLYL